MALVWVAWRLTSALPAAGQATLGAFQGVAAGVFALWFPPIFIGFTGTAFGCFSPGSDGPDPVPATAAAGSIPTATAAVTDTDNARTPNQLTPHPIHRKIAGL